MNRYLIVVDMQNDFIDGVLGTPEAVGILPRVKSVIDGFEGRIIYTKDTHTEHYLETEEGKNLPIPHCIKGTNGWELSDLLDSSRAFKIIDKLGFGSLVLADILIEENERERIDEIVLIGICTDICVISNAMLLKSALYDTRITVDASACAGVTPEGHKRALDAMKVCHINVINN